MFLRFGFLLFVITFCNARMYEGNFELVRKSTNETTNFFYLEENTFTWNDIKGSRLALASKIKIDKKAEKFAKNFLCSDKFKNNLAALLTAIFGKMFMENKECFEIQKNEEVGIQNTVFHRFSWGFGGQVIKFKITMCLYKAQHKNINMQPKDSDCIMVVHVKGKAKKSSNFYRFK